jgi:HAD superfamily hydrolase (TIGR01459 family)
MQPSSSTAEIPITSHIAPFAARAEAWLVDIWGVMHNGVAAFADANQACRTFREGGGIVVLLSNAPRPAAAVAEQLDRIGVPRAAWDAIISSGDATRTLLERLPPARKVFHLGPSRDLPIYDGLGLTQADESAADLVVCTGLFDDESETPDDYAPLLTRFAAHGVAMICANPDLTVERGGKLVYCAGAIAAAYEAMGGSVTYAGKPHPPIYDMACAWIAQRAGRSIDKAEVLAIGDGIKTDIVGASRAGIASVYIASAVHMPHGAALEPAVLREMFSDPAVQPIAAMPGLAW